MMTPELILSQREELLHLQKELFHSALSRKGQRAQNRPSRSDLEAGFSKAQAEAAAISTAEGGLHSVRQTVVGYSYPPCTTPLTDLTPITIDELRLETNHTGRVLFARRFGYPLRVQAVQAAISDATGDVDRIAVYNFEPGLSPEMVLPSNAIFAIKQPYYKLTMDGGVIIRVDHPSDLVLLPDLDERAPWQLWSPSGCDAEDTVSLKLRGNEAFKQKNFRLAVELYTEGLKKCSQSPDDIRHALENCKVTMQTCDSSTAMSKLRGKVELYKKRLEGIYKGDGDAPLRFDFYRNRAIANINLQRYEAGLADAESAVIPDLAATDTKGLEGNVKAWYRAGCAAYHAGDFDKASQNFVKVLKASPKDENASRELKRACRRLKEQSKGEYDFEVMADCGTNQRLDHADFLKKVELRRSKTAGNGLFATKIIRAGELVLCEKAFVVAFDSDSSTESTVIINLNTNSASMGTHASRLVGAAHKMLHSPKQAAKFLTLYDRDYTPKASPHLVDGRVSVDTFQVQAALEVNGFGCPPISTVSEVNTETTTGGGSTGSWVVASYINHDCIGNAQRAFIGDMMIIHATKDIAKDEEIFMRYKNADDDNVLFQKTLQDSWGFNCKCRLCIAETQTPEAERQARIALLKDTRVFLDSNAVDQFNAPKPSTVIKAEKLRAKVDKSYNDNIFHALPRLGLHDLDHWLCMAYILRGSHEKLAGAGLSVLHDQGIDLAIKGDAFTVLRKFCRPDVTGIHAATYVAASYFRQGNQEMGDNLELLAKELYRIGYGTLRGFHSRISSSA